MSSSRPAATRLATTVSKSTCSVKRCSTRTSSTSTSSASAGNATTRSKKQKTATDDASPLPWLFGIEERLRASSTMPRWFKGWGRRSSRNQARHLVNSCGHSSTTSPYWIAGHLWLIWRVKVRKVRQWARLSRSGDFGLSDRPHATVWCKRAALWSIIL